MRCSGIRFVLFLAPLLFVAIAAEAMASSAPQTVSDPEIPVEHLELLVKPLTADELIVEADGWLSILRDKVREISLLEIEVREQREEVEQVEELAEVTEEAADAAQEAEEALDEARGTADQAAAQEAREKLEEARLEELEARRERPLWISHGDSSASIFLPMVEEIRSRAVRRPAMSRAAVFVIGDAERMVPQASSPEAANAFLKLLEEPPSDTLLFLTSSRPGALLPTIRSRVLEIRVTPPSSE